MKIMTDKIDVEMTIEEFEDLLEKGLLDFMVTIIASLSTKVGSTKESNTGDVTSLLNELLDNRLGSEEFEELCKLADDFDDELDDMEEELDEIEEQNETVLRIYHNLFKNGERLWP